MRGREILLPGWILVARYWMILAGGPLADDDCWILAEIDRRTLSNPTTGLGALPATGLPARAYRWNVCVESHTTGPRIWEGCVNARFVWLAAYVEAHEAGACHYGHDMTDGQGHGRK